MSDVNQSNKNEQDVNQSNKNDSDIIEGRNPVMEALKAGRTINKILVANGSKEGSIKKIMGMAKEAGIVIQHVDRQKLNQVSTSDNHQGIIAYVSAYDYVELKDLLDKLENKEGDKFLMILDEINDPHNLGSILRTADAVGVDGVIIAKRRAVGLTSVVSKTSAGAIEYVPVCKVGNISRAIDEIKERGIWVAGADMDGEANHYKSNLKGNIALVMGNEGKGISRLVKEHCDFLVKIPMVGQVSSLNASVAAGVLMYEVYRQRNDG